MDEGLHQTANKRCFKQREVKWSFRFLPTSHHILTSFIKVYEKGTNIPNRH